jgi:hypothetical protein
MEESLESRPADTRKKLPGSSPSDRGQKAAGIDHGVLVPSGRGSGLTRSQIERPSTKAKPTHSGRDSSASAAATVAIPASNDDASCLCIA